MSSVLEDWQRNILDILNAWIDKFTKIRFATSFLSCIVSLLSFVKFLLRSSTFNARNCFILYQEDTPSAIILQANSLLESACSEYRKNKDGMSMSYFKILEHSGLREDQYDVEFIGDLREDSVSK